MNLKLQHFANSLRIHRNFFSVLVLALEFHKAINQRKDSVVLAYADIVARVCGCAALAYDDIARTHEFSAEFFHAQTAPYGVSVVLSRALPFFVCHFLLLMPLCWRL